MSPNIHNQSQRRAFLKKVIKNMPKEFQIAYQHELISDIRNAQSRSKPIVIDGKKISSQQMKDIVDRLSEKKARIEKTDNTVARRVFSSDKIYKQISSVDIAVRLSKREILRDLEKFNLTKKQEDIIGQLIQYGRKQFIPNTKIPLFPEQELILVNLINSFQEHEKFDHTHKILAEIANTAHKIQRRSNDSHVVKSDVFANIGPRLTALKQLFEMEMELGKKEYVKRLLSLSEDRDRQIMLAIKQGVSRNIINKMQLENDTAKKNILEIARQH